MRLRGNLISKQSNMSCNVLYRNVDTSEGGREGGMGGTSAHIMPRLCYVFLLNVATFARAAKVQCWITSCNVQLF